MGKRISARTVYTLLFLALLLTEILIALFVQDDFIRPYGGDILVTVLIGCFVRIFIPNGLRLLPLWVFLFAAAVEIGQYFDFVSLLGAGNNTFFRILLGSTFSWVDLVCYGAGCFLFFLFDHCMQRKE